jgi:hypothetical protein
VAEEKQPSASWSENPARPDVREKRRSGCLAMAGGRESDDAGTRH